MVIVCRLLAGSGSGKMDDRAISPRFEISVQLPSYLELWLRAGLGKESILFVLKSPLFLVSILWLEIKLHGLNGQYCFLRMFVYILHLTYVKFCLTRRSVWRFTGTKKRDGLLTDPTFNINQETRKKKKKKEKEKPEIHDRRISSTPDNCRNLCPLVNPILYHGLNLHQ